MLDQVRQLLKAKVEERIGSLPKDDPVLNDLYGAPRMPGRVKPQEQPRDEEGRRAPDLQNEKELPPRVTKQTIVRINPGWRDLTLEPGFTPVSGVMYLWVVREDGNLIIGVEVDKGKNTEAFEDFEGRDSQLEEGGALGHPTLAAAFDPETGEAVAGEGRIGGELHDHEGRWFINDHSGRYSGGRDGTGALLQEAVGLFNANGVNVQGFKLPGKEGDLWTIVWNDDTVSEVPKKG